MHTQLEQLSKPWYATSFVHLRRGLVLFTFHIHYRDPPTCGRGTLRWTIGKSECPPSKPWLVGLCSYYLCRKRCVFKTHRGNSTHTHTHTPMNGLEQDARFFTDVIRGNPCGSDSHRCESCGYVGQFHAMEFEAEDEGVPFTD